MSLVVALFHYFGNSQLPPFNMEILEAEAAQLQEETADVIAEHWFLTFVPPIVRKTHPALEAEYLKATIPLFRKTVLAPVLIFPPELTEQERFYYAQVNTTAELEELLLTYRAEGNLNTLRARRRLLSPWKDAVNKVTLGGIDTTLYSSEQLLPLYSDASGSYLFDIGDTYYLLRTLRNPYTGNILKAAYRRSILTVPQWKLSLRPHPLDQVLNGSWCGGYNFYAPNPSAPQRYYETITPKQLGDKISPNLLRKEYALTPWHPLIVYTVDAQYRLNKIIHNPYVKPQPHVPERRLTDVTALKLISDFHMPASSGFRNIDPRYWPLFERLGFKGSQPLKLYRGLDKIRGVSVGDLISLPSEKIQSWTPNICVAEGYAAYSYNNVSSGVVVSTVLRPEDILIDSRYISTEQLAASVDLLRKDPFLRTPGVLFIPCQNEILSKPGDYAMVVEKVVKPWKALGQAWRADIQTSSLYVL